MNFIIQVTFESLAQPDELTTGLALLITGIMGILAFIGIKLNSPVTIGVWAFAMFAFIMHILLGISFVYFWLVVVIDALATLLSMAVYVTYSTKI